MTDELEKRSLRLLIDMQACQTESSGLRGVGRYSHAFYTSLIAEAQHHDIFAHLTTDLPVPVQLDGLSEARILRSPSLPAWESNRDFRGGEQDSLNSLALSAFIAPVKADIIHVSHVFEDLGNRVSLPNLAQRSPGQVISATLYDLIPLKFHEHYLKDENVRKWYLSRVTWLRQADLLLAISESTRQDAIDLGGIEPWRIVTIHGGVSSHFIPPINRHALHRKLAAQYGLRERFVLYTGGDDYRKNINGAIAGYAAVPAEMRNNCQLVILCNMPDERRQMYMNKAESVGLKKEDIVITGYVPEKDLVALYGTCDLFIFPSLYEGLGLPVLEAMACGAPVIGGNNSSIKEIIVRSDAIFDAASAQSIGNAIANALCQPGFTDILREYGLQRAKDFSWQKTASRALEAFDDVARRTRESGVQYAIHGWLPRKRLAMFTPLPPCRSGIADYNAQFLPYLARYFDIDLYVDNYKVADEMLTSSFRIFNAQDFEAVASQYEAILYEFGNSEFHTHMLPLLEKYPGVVGLHDAYLSGLFGFLDFNLGLRSYANEMLTAHGTAARRYFAPVKKHPNAIGETVVQLPCTKRVLDNAIGVISHSPFNLEIARSYYPEGWQAPYRIIPQMISVPPKWSEEQRIAARKRLGFQPGEFIITTFGHIVWTKWGDRLLEAYLKSTLSRDKQVHLVFAGELPKDDFGQTLKDAIQASGLKDHVHITDFLSKQDYECYLHIADLAVQLRTKSRGGTPKGVLDCLAYGVPIVVNNDASFTDYPDDVVIKLSAEPSIEEIAQILELMYADASKRKAHADAGLRYVQHYHDPAVCAASYAAAIHEFVERHRQTLAKSYIPAVAPHLAGCSQPDEAVKLAIDWINNIPSPSFQRRRLFIDVSHIAQTDLRTGIQRVVKEIVRGLYCSADTMGIEPVAVELAHGSLQIAVGWLQSQGLLLSAESEYLKENARIEFQPGDVLLMLDSSWERYQEFFPVFKQARSNHVPIYTAVYDLLPLTLPPGNTVDGLPEWFAGWFRDAIRSSDGLVCISRAVAEDVKAYLDSITELTNRPKIGYWHLGANFENIAENGDPSQSILALDNHPYLLMVGTIEPRKRHALALAAMEQIWEQGSDLRLCISGKEGWKTDQLMERLRNHPLARKKLFLFENLSDADLHELYANASGLLFLSRGEGFGLPLIEAAHHGIPIICSDIPVFQEIAGNFATFVRTDEPDKLANDIKEWWARKQAQQLPDTRLMPRLTWEQSSKMLLQLVMNNEWIRSDK
jgi:glycosyltransferase involved in cell wall biosynthesis